MCSSALERTVMAQVTLEHVSKVFPNGIEAVSDLNLEVADGEFLVLVGPSGCGKTTALRMVAGLEETTSGVVRFGDRVVTDLAPRDRDVAMVFQNYALYPHMTVGDNIGFALQLRKLPKEEIAARVRSAAEILGLTEHLKRKPAQLSGGQRQRVAMGRAIVREPAVFLMDEPLSNLDAKLRVQMRAEISRIQRRVGVATLYVTHDQTEAMTMGDRVAVLRTGALQQIAAPQVLYDSPVNLFVAAFIGSPAMNLYEGAISEDGRAVQLGHQSIDMAEDLRDDPALVGYRNSPVIVGIRPEHLSDAALGDPPGDGLWLEGDVELVEALGSEKLVHFRIDARRLGAHEAVAGLDGSDDSTAVAEGEIGVAAMTVGVARVDAQSAIRADQRVRLRVDNRRLMFFDPIGGQTLVT
jgi:multiple sugar transport system ATP-binding protein